MTLGYTPTNWPMLAMKPAFPSGLGLGLGLGLGFVGDEASLAGDPLLLNLFQRRVQAEPSARLLSSRRGRRRPRVVDLEEVQLGLGLGVGLGLGLGPVSSTWRRSALGMATLVRTSAYSWYMSLLLLAVHWLCGTIRLKLSAPPWRKTTTTAL